MKTNMTQKLLFRLLPVQILLAVIGSINGIVSSLFASNAVGIDAMSAVGLYNPINLFITAFGMMLVGGSSILCGKYIGRDQQDRVQNIFSLSIVLSVILSVFFVAVLLVIGLFDLSGFLTQDEAVRPLLNQYLIGQAIGVLPLLMGGQLSSFLSLQNKTRVTTAASIIYILVNVAFNFLFVHLLHMQALGLALASSLGLWVFFLVQAQAFARPDSTLRLTFKGIQWKDTGDIVRVGIPGAANNGYQTIRGFIVNMLVLQYVGAEGISAFAAANTLLGLAWAVPAGMLNVSRMLISISVGEEDRTTLMDTMHNMVYRFMPLMCVISAALIASAVPLTKLYYRDVNDPVFMMTVWGFRILPLCMPLPIFRMHFSCFGQAMDRNVMVNLLEAVDGFVFVCLFTWILIPSMGIRSVYWANVINGVLVMVCILIYSILMNRRWPRNLADLIVVPETFGVPEEDRMDLSLHSMEEVIRISKGIEAFCLEKGIDRRRAYFAGLSMEEMAGNVVAHGFRQDGKQHSVDVRVTYKDDSVLLRLKDDCAPFNPLDRKTLFDPEDPAKNIGIRMIAGIAQEIRYQNILGLNVLSVRV